MSALTNVMVDELDTALVSEELPIIMPKPVVRREFFIDTQRGVLSIAETTNFQALHLRIQHGDNKADLPLSYEEFAELAHLYYVVKCTRAEVSPF